MCIWRFRPKLKPLTLLDSCVYMFEEYLCICNLWTVLMSSELSHCRDFPAFLKLRRGACWILENSIWAIKNGKSLFCLKNKITILNYFKTIYQCSEIVSMIRNNHNHKLQTTLWHPGEEPLNHHETPGRQIKQSNQLSLPHQDDCNTRMDIK